MEKTWFETTAKANFEKWLLPLADDYIRCIQLGCFTGDASVWLMENLPKAHLVDVDTFEGSGEHMGIDFAKVQEVYSEVTAPYDDRITTWMGTTFGFLTDSSLSLEEFYGFIYVDADHRAPEVLRDAVMSWPLLESGGILAFDDYHWGERIPYLQTPKPAIDAFVTVYGDQLTVLEANAQVWVRKD